MTVNTVYLSLFNSNSLNELLRNGNVVETC